MKKNEDERDLDEASELLRTIEPSLQARLNNHRVVAAELERLQMSTSVSWWKRSMTLPVPAAIGLGVLACSIAVIPWLFLFQIPSRQAPLQLTSQSADDLAIDAASNQGTELVSTTYLCGVGAIERETVLWHEE